MRYYKHLLLLLRSGGGGGDGGVGGRLVDPRSDSIQYISNGSMDTDSSWNGIHIQVDFPLQSLINAES